MNGCGGCGAVLGVAWDDFVGLRIGEDEFSCRKAMVFIHDTVDAFACSLAEFDNVHGEAFGFGIQVAHLDGQHELLSAFEAGDRPELFGFDGARLLEASEGFVGRDAMLPEPQA